MVVFNVDDLEIEFPFVPYDVQKELMRKVVDCMENRQNGLLESPTGTGKTLSLLCAAVAWQKKQTNLAKKAFATFGGSKGLMLKSQQSIGGNVGSPDTLNVPKIIYASRTHAQLSQAAQELKRSFYVGTKTVVLGSRDVMCIHEGVSRLNNSASKIMACHMHVQARTCHFYNNINQKKEEISLGIADKPVMDIEDLVSTGRKNRFCPFFMSRELVKEANLIFMPYNYLMDPKLRSSHGVDLKNCIIILDEGHNIAKTCEESVSFEIKNSTVAKCIQEVTRTMNEFNEISQQIGSNTNALMKDLSMGSLVTLKQSFLQLEETLDKFKLTNPTGVLIPGHTVLSSIFQNGFPPSTFPKVINELDAISSFNAMSNHDSTGCDAFGSILRILSSQAVFLNPVLFADSYKIFLTEEKSKTKLGSVKSDNIPKVFNFWCFNPAVGLEMMMQYGPRCIILASGTLSPLPFLESELQIPFPVKLSNPHIIGDNQLYACILKNGPGPKCAKMSSSFQNRNNIDYLNGLGEIVVATCSVVPKGILVFFPSYTVMDGCVNSWKSSGIFDRIGALKSAYVEPRGKYEFNQVMSNYYQSVKSSNGACLMAVCRGKVSEGLDFSDDNGRAVVITGIPYSPYLDPHVVAKKAYLDGKKKDSRSISGQTWYQLEAVRALNQAVGRIIRHAQDFGAVLLCDDRCDAPDVLRNLSPWLEKRLKKTSDFLEMTRGLSQFFKTPSKSFGHSYSQSQKGGRGCFQSTTSQIKTKSRPSLLETESMQDVDMDSDVSSLYSVASNKTHGENSASSSDLFANLGSLKIRPAADYAEEKRSGSSRNVCEYPESTRTTIIKHAKRRHIKVEPNTMMDYESEDQSKAKKTKLQFVPTHSYTASSTSPTSLQFTSMDTDSPSAESLLTFTSVNEFFEWVKVDLSPAKYSEFVSAVRDYRISKDVSKLGVQIKSLFCRSKLFGCVEGLKFILPDIHVLTLRSSFEPEKPTSSIFKR